MKKELQDILDKVGNTPIEEPKIFGLLKDKKNEVVADVLESLGIDIDKYGQDEMAELFNSVATKITSFVSDDGVFKITPNTEPMRLPNIREGQKITNFLVELADKSGDKKLYYKFEKYVFEVTKLDKKKLSDWEIMLVVEQLSVASTNAIKTAYGNQAKK